MWLRYDLADLRRFVLEEIAEWDPSDSSEFMADLDIMFHDLLHNGLIQIDHPYVRDVQFGEHGDNNERLEIVLELANEIGIVSTATLPLDEEVVGGHTGLDALIHALAYISHAGSDLLQRLDALINSARST
ncbi:hypothetical protein HDA40_001924 [Hamadaea flava]|uniref:Uncharacterized protein n=1 Tax=Hamadaea flava TaxID=1742688 RepID=A0ABV8LDR4_9ACTN|nr:hypothetical protein [Hamadaea flava]MCP2323417.1 hypothetical protein [Hamadaea flava]